MNQLHDLNSEEQQIVERDHAQIDAMIHDKSSPRLADRSFQDLRWLVFKY